MKSCAHLPAPIFTCHGKQVALLASCHYIFCLFSIKVDGESTRIGVLIRMLSKSIGISCAAEFNMTGQQKSTKRNFREMTIYHLIPGNDENAKYYKLQITICYIISLQPYIVVHIYNDTLNV